MALPSPPGARTFGGSPTRRLVNRLMSNETEETHRGAERREEQEGRGLCQAVQTVAHPTVCTALDHGGSSSPGDSHARGLAKNQGPAPQKNANTLINFCTRFLGIRVPLKLICGPPRGITDVRLGTCVLDGEDWVGRARWKTCWHL